MRLRRLEIQGFKSFADKVSLELPQKICAIIGPNGSGKSNIVDALRWVLGEQSQKQIRIQESTDVIFSGSPSRVRNSMALVNLEFHDPDNTFGLGLSDVVFQRKLTRDGEGSFFINNQQARLKDIVLYLTRAKTGVHGVSVVNQGAVDAVLKANPFERYQMLLETLGLKELEIKKEESKRKLIESKNNLKEIYARREEIRPQLRFLKKEKEKAENKGKLKEALRTGELDFFSNKFYSLAEQKKEVKSKLEPLKKEKEFLEKEIKKNELEIESQKAPKVELSGELIKREEKLNQKRDNLIKELAKLEAMIALKDKLPSRNFDSIKLKEKLEYVSQELKEASILEPEILLEKINNLIIDIDEFLTEEPKTQDSYFNKELEGKNKLELELSKIQEELKAVKSELAGQREKSFGFEEDFQKIFEAYKQKQNKLLDLDHEISSLTYQEEKNNEEELRTNALWRESIFGFKKEDLTPPSRISSDQELREKERQVLNLRLRYQEVGEVDREVLKEAEKIFERYEMLSRESGDLEKAIGDLKKLIKQLDEDIKNNFRKYIGEISHEFNNYFRLIFSGGKASIFSKKEIIQEESNEGQENKEKESEVREVVEISVEPPGKKIKGLEMLSGGERALSAISLLFAIVKTSQPPFLILDEIDAALDENNAQKFAKILKELSLISQFIVITHNRATMEVAESLFGITMDKDAVSKIISLRLEEV